MRIPSVLILFMLGSMTVRYANKTRSSISRPRRECRPELDAHCCGIIWSSEHSIPHLRSPTAGTGHLSPPLPPPHTSPIPPFPRQSEMSGRRLPAPRTDKINVRSAAVARGDASGPQMRVVSRREWVGALAVAGTCQSTWRPVWRCYVWFSPSQVVPYVIVIVIVICTVGKYQAEVRHLSHA